MDIWATDKLVLFLVFVIPGFISLKTYAVLGLRAPRDSSQQLIDAIAFSCVNYALLALPIFWIETSDAKDAYPKLYAAFYLFVVLVAPAVWGLLWKWIRTWQALQRFLPHPVERPWDYVFGQRRPFWVIATLKNGTKIGGKFAEKSFSSAGPSPDQIYLEETWVVNRDGGLERPRVDTAGVLIVGQQIASIELFEYK